jgi:hypothetical protein
MSIVTEKFLLSIGFQKDGKVTLPDWYNIFEIEPLVTTCEAFSFCTNETALTIFVTPKGLIAESCSNDEFRDLVEYHSIRSHEDVIDCVEGCLGMNLCWKKEE